MHLTVNMHLITMCASKPDFTVICTNSPLIMGLNYEVLASFKDLLKPITSDKVRFKTYGRHFREYLVFYIKSVNLYHMAP